MATLIMEVALSLMKVPCSAGLRAGLVLAVIACEKTS